MNNRYFDEAGAFNHNTHTPRTEIESNHDSVIEAGASMLRILSDDKAKPERLGWEEIERRYKFHLKALDLHWRKMREFDKVRSAITYLKQVQR